MLEPGSPWSHYTRDLKKRGRKKICDWLWKRIVINPDGSVSPCCAYYPQKFDFDTIDSKRAKEAFNNEKYIEARRVFGEGSSRVFVICIICKRLGNFIDI